jgi:hypothetical protein
VYEDEFNRANCFHAGCWWQLACAGGGDGITHKVNAGWDVFQSLKLGNCGGTAPAPRRTPIEAPQRKCARKAPVIA